MDNETGSSVPRRQLGRMLKDAREHAGLSLQAAARELEFSPNKMYRIEGGATPLRKVDVVAMCSVYEVAADVAPVLVALAAETKARGWWHAYGAEIPTWFELFVGLEAAAIGIRQFQAGVVPGLLQVEEYAAVVFRRSPEVAEDQVASKVRVRMDRQRILTRRVPRPPVLDVILDESVLRRPIPDRAGWRRQLDALGAASQRPGVRLRVIPASAGPYRSADHGSFVILDFPKGGRNPEPTTVYSEGLTGAMYLDKPADAAAFNVAWDALATLALSPEGSLALLHAIQEENPQ